MGKFAAKIERVITIALILSVMLILIPGVSVQAKAKKCNHKSVTWITTSKSSCTDEGMKVKKCKDKEDKKIRTPLTHTNRENAYMHKTGINGNVLFKSRLYLWL